VPAPSSASRAEGVQGGERKGTPVARMRHAGASASSLTQRAARGMGHAQLGARPQRLGRAQCGVAAAAARPTHAQLEAFVVAHLTAVTSTAAARVFKLLRTLAHKSLLRGPPDAPGPSSCKATECGRWAISHTQKKGSHDAAQRWACTGPLALPAAKWRGGDQMMCVVLLLPAQSSSPAQTPFADQPS
jgi:hypothetical protein